MMSAGKVTTQPLGSRWVGVTIPDTGTTSGRVNIADNEVPVAFLTDSSFDGTTFEFIVSNSATGTYVTAYKNDGSTKLGELTGGASKSLLIEPAQAVGLGPHFKIVAGTQTGTTTIYVLVRRLH